MLGIQSPSLNIGAGHPMTPRDHVCGDFSDAFDWSSLPLAYQKRVGVRATPLRNPVGEGQHG